ncbi:MAG: phosphoenolpyruvate carboxykinase (ATP), partial [Desulforhabdus sp.]|nr:phosphoenolpyruvate carboxykinase (ATP) [Desulforhabdus sp.]
PAVAQLSTEQAVYHFLSGYTAKVAGTEIGVKEPQATFSACFGAPFMALPPTFYARLLMEKIETHDVKCWLVNTGWAGKPYGESERIRIAHSRAIVKSVLTGRLDSVEFEVDPLFGFRTPLSCESVPADILNPRRAVTDKSGYEHRAARLADDFQEEFRTV